MRAKITLILNILITVFTVTGIVIMFALNAPKGALSAYGFANFKYYTVLSNVICGVIAVLFIRRQKSGRIPSWLYAAKLMAASAVMLTFLTIACFLGPIYGHAMMYNGSNFFFHLIVPLLAIADYILLDTGNKVPVRHVLFSAVPTILYGVCYTLNLLINGIGQWPDTNDWYGFVNWGYPVGFGIFAMIILATLAAGFLLRAMNHWLRR